MCDKEEKDMNGTADIRYCSPSESLKRSIQEMKLMRQGKKKKHNWREMVKNIEKDMDEGKL